ncbi:hypothetical protein K457DRAFT_130529 [Linnemannia elongata AG-77]|uniref:Uncharacterized protein n=1 Tax=Linnemannia elongata AG-77 TaxID=1314771 RepID=A0A197JEB3_9FUNG|nr:hypothetical protein K457DRAFT_130529 [Linnemannia elongata AG-77]
MFSLPLRCCAPPATISLVVLHPTGLPTVTNLKSRLALDACHAPSPCCTPISVVKTTFRFAPPGPLRIAFWGQCVDEMGVTINRGDIGSEFKICPDSNIRMGLYFPHGYNGTISEAYDYHNKVFYPCVRINNEVTKSYACGGVFMQDFLPK